MKSYKLAKVMILLSMYIIVLKGNWAFLQDALITMGQSLLLTEEELKLEINDKK